MYDWIESQLSQILTQSFNLENEDENEDENVDEETFRLLTQGRMLQIEFMLQSEMIKQYLTKNEIECLTLTFEHTDANLFCRD